MNFKQTEINRLWCQALADTGRGASPCSPDLVTAFARLIRNHVQTTILKEIAEGRHAKTLSSIRASYVTD